MTMRRSLTDLNTPLSIGEICLLLGISYRYALRLAQRGYIQKQGSIYTVLSVQAYIKGLRRTRRAYKAAMAAKKRRVHKRSFWDLPSKSGDIALDLSALDEEITSFCRRLNTVKGRGEEK